jgi:beta-glucanase (GH16 family)
MLHRHRSPARVTAVALGVVIALAGVALGAALATRGGGAHWVRVWSGSFTGPAGSPVSQRSWAYQAGSGGFGNGEVETMTTSVGNVHLDGRGALDITATGRGTSWTSGRIRTRRIFRVPAGGGLMVTASIRQPGPAGAIGYWPAFWLLGPGSWPEHGEIDVLEDVNGLDAHAGALHCGNLAQANPDGTFGPCHEQNGLGSGLRPCPGCQRGYHRYSVIIDRRDVTRQQVRWYLDGHQFFSVSESRVGVAAWRAAFSHGFAIILDLAIGGSYPDAICRCRAPAASTTSGGTMSVRDVSVYRAS